MRKVFFSSSTSSSSPHPPPPKPPILSDFISPPSATRSGCHYKNKAKANRFRPLTTLDIPAEDASGSVMRSPSLTKPYNFPLPPELVAALGPKLSAVPASAPVADVFSKYLGGGLDPAVGSCSDLITREKAMLINLEFIKAIVTAEEILLLDPLCQEVLPFVDQLRRQIPHKSPCEINVDEECDGENELPFEFQVLEVALEVVCSYWDSNVSDLERDAYPVLDELAMKVNTKNLEKVRSLKSNLTSLLARVQKIKDEIEHLLDNHGDIAHLYLSRKLLLNQQDETLSYSGASNAILPTTHLSNASTATSTYFESKDVEDLEMLLEDYFMQLNGTCNKILSVREYINDTEDYINIQLDSKRNELIQLQLIMTIADFVLAIYGLIVGFLSVNLPLPIFQTTDKNLFWFVVIAISCACFFIFDILLVYARWKKLL